MAGAAESARAQSRSIESRFAELERRLADLESRIGTMERRLSRTDRAGAPDAAPATTQEANPGAERPARR
jgi:hypothetical protein